MCHLVSNKYFKLEQEEYVFDFNIINKSVALLINSSGQIVCKMKYFARQIKVFKNFGISLSEHDALAITVVPSKGKHM